MALITDNDPQSNEHLFITDFPEVFGAGRNGFVINLTNIMNADIPVVVSAVDYRGIKLPVNLARPNNSKFGGETATGTTYVVRIDSTVKTGIGKLSIKAKLLNGDDLLWERNILIEPTKINNSSVTFFDFPKIKVRQEIYPLIAHSSCPYEMASGSFYSTAVIPKNNFAGDYDYHFDQPIYQIFMKTGTEFTSKMEGEKIRLSGVTVKKFSYSNFANNNLSYEGSLNTDFIATVKRVMNSSSLRLDIPFSTVSDLIGKTNIDSEYSKNDLVDIKGYSPENDVDKQGSFHKKNFYVLSLDSGNFEIVYKNSPYSVAVGAKKQSVLNIEFQNMRTLCGKITHFKINKKSLSYPHSSMEILSGKIEPTELIVSTNVMNGVYNFPGRFYNQTHMNRFWLNSGGGLQWNQNGGVLIDGAKISHVGNTAQADYVIFKDDTTEGGRTATYIPYNLMSNSHWYGDNQAFNNVSSLPNSSYPCVGSIPSISGYVSSQENLMNDSIHNSNPIKLVVNTLHQFSMRVRSEFGNSDSSKIYVYFISGTEKTQIGLIDSGFNYGADELYTKTFFVDSTKYGTIMLVPVQGGWNISELSIKPFSDTGYSPDSFSVKVPIQSVGANELVEIEVELIGGDGKVAYGKGSNSFLYNKVFSPLKERIFLDPSGITL